ncbi:MAG: heavy-metal-associated domain-containing protein [Halobacteriales archaeon]
MTIQITVEGMNCEHCEQTVVDALESLDGVERASADRETDSATVEGTVAPSILVDTVADAGYSATV